MFAYTNAAKASMLADFVGKTEPTDPVTHLSLHSADPSTTGANETSDSRITIAESNWSGPAGGFVELLSDWTFAGPASGNVTHFGIWNATDPAASGGTFLGGGAITGDATFNSGGEYVLQSETSLDLNS